MNDNKTNKASNDYLKCPFCNGNLIWSSDSNASDVCDEYDESDTAVVSYYLCSKCGRDYEVFEPKESDRMGEYKDYWNNIPK